MYPEDWGQRIRCRGIVVVLGDRPYGNRETAPRLGIFAFDLVSSFDRHLLVRQESALGY